MSQLEQINIKLKELNSELISLAKSIEFEKICEFNLENCKNTIPWDDIMFSGVYQIEIKNDERFNDFTSWVTNFRDEWEDLRYKKKFVPNLRKVRIAEHTELKEWIPIYIGKSKQIKGRIHQHIYKELVKPTFALKLNERDNMKKYTFRLSVIKGSPDNYDWVMPVFEKTLRDRIHPIIGRQ